MDILVQLFSITNIMLCLAIVALVWVQRKGIELLFKKAFKKDLSKSGVWTEFLVPLGPIGTAALVMLIPGIPVMAMFATTTGAKLIFGLGMGLVANLGYRLVKKNILDKLGKSNGDSTDYSK